MAEERQSYRGGPDKEEKIEYHELVSILLKENRTAEEVKKIATYFNTIKFFADCKTVLKQDQYSRLLRAITFEKIGRNQFLFHKGDRGNKFYVIMKGHTNVVVNRPSVAEMKENKIYKRYMARVLTYLQRRSKGLVIERAGSEDLMKERNKRESISKPRAKQRKGIEMTTKELQLSMNEVVKMQQEEVDRDESEIQRLNDKFEEVKKMDHPNLKITKGKSILGFMLTKLWNEKLKTKETSDLFFDKNVFFPYRPKVYWHNLLLYGLRCLDEEFIMNLLPGLMRVHQIGVGGYFGEIAILGNGLRAAGIYCDEDSEFAVISKKYENDFLFLYRAQNKEKELTLKQFKLFNYWIERDKIKGLFHYMKKMKTKYGNHLYRMGEPIQGMYLITQGEIELVLHRKKDAVFLNKNFRDNRKDYEFEYRRIISHPYIIGVEEIILNSKNRILEAKVISESAEYYMIPIEVSSSMVTSRTSKAIS